MVAVSSRGWRPAKRWRWGRLGGGLLLVLGLSPALVGGQSPAAGAAPMKEAVADERQANLEAARLILEQGLKERNPDHRCEAVIALSLTRVENNPFPLLETALADKDVYVQVAACATLAGLSDPRALPLLRQALGSETPEVAFAAAKALYAQGDEEGRQALLDVAMGERQARSGYFSVQRRNLLRTMKTPGGFSSGLSLRDRFCARAGAGDGTVFACRAAGRCQHFGPRPGHCRPAACPGPGDRRHAARGADG